MEGEITFTVDDLKTLQEHLDPMEFDKILEEIEAFHGVRVYDTLVDVPVVDKRGYSLE